MKTNENIVPITETSTVEAIKPAPANIHLALLHVYASVGYVQKSGEFDGGKGGKYKYASESDLIAALRPAMVEAGIIFYPLDVTYHQEMTTDIYNGAPKNKKHIQAVYTYRFMHPASDTFIDVKAIGEGVGSDDKSSYKAATGAMKYALRQTFMIETGDDPDKDPDEEKRKKKEAEEMEARRKQEEEYQKLLQILYVAPPVDEDWIGYTSAIIKMIKSTKERSTLTDCYRSNKESLRWLEEADKQLRDQVKIAFEQQSKIFEKATSTTTK